MQHVIGAGAWSPDGSSFAFSANSRPPEDTEVFLWRDGDDEPRYVFGEGMYAFPACFSPDGSKLIALEFRSNSDMSLHLVDVASGDTSRADAARGRGEVPARPVGRRTAPASTC